MMAGGRSSKPSVLVADDSDVVRGLLREQLSSHGFDVTEASHGEQALAMARTTAPDVVLVDLEMPALDSYGLLAAIKADRALENIPVVFVTSRESTAHLVDALERGAHDYLRKPFDSAELLARIQAAVRVKHLQDELRELNGRLEKQACTDQLTGIYNRRFLDNTLEMYVSRAARHERPLAVLLLDVDRFKDINDTLGHHAGDRVLVNIAGRLTRRLRREDIMGRWGGEEFMVLAPDTGASGAAALADALRRAIAESPVQLEDRTLDITASVGWATWQHDSPENIMRRADAALYAAKAAGRNVVKGETP
jgi:two-component system cell cycle response regulator